MIYQFKDDETRWINFENPKGERGRGGMENNGAKGHAFERLLSGEEKVLCDFSGCGVIRRIWMTLSDRSAYILQNVYQYVLGSCGKSAGSCADRRLFLYGARYYETF